MSTSAVPVLLPSLLDTDLYKMTMQQAVLQHFPEAQVTYRFTNRAPDMLFTRVSVDAIQKSIEHLGRLRFAADELSWLRTHCAYFREPYLQFLSSFQLQPAEQIKLSFVPHGDGEYGHIDLEIHGLWKEVILYEVPVMAIISETYFALCEQDWSIRGQRELAYKKGRQMLENGVILSEFGTRRRRSFATHEAVIQGLLDAHTDIQSSNQPGAGKLLGTSNVYFAKKYHLAPSGTIAHEWTMGIAAIRGYDHANLHALQLWDQVYQPPAFTPETVGDNLTIALTDTFSTKVFWDDLLHDDKGIELLKRWRGLRQDSGDSAKFLQHAVDVYRRIGIDPSKKLIVFSDGLDVARCLELQKLTKEVGILAGFGVGTNLTNDFTRLSSGERSKALNMVIKLYSINGHHTVKISDDLTKNTGDQDEIDMVKRRFGLYGLEHVEDA